MSAKATDIKNLIKTRINNLNKVQSVYGYEELEVEGYPAVWVTLGSMNGEFVSNAENRRIYSFNVTVAMSLGQDYDGQTGNREEFVENTISNVIDDIINDVDDNYELDGTTILFVDAADYTPGIIEMSDGKAKAVQITLLIHTDYNVT